LLEEGFFRWAKSPLSVGEGFEELSLLDMHPCSMYQGMLSPAQWNIWFQKRGRHCLVLRLFFFLHTRKSSLCGCLHNDGNNFKALWRIIIIYLNIFCLFSVCVCVCTGNLWESVCFFFYHVGSKDWTQVLRLGKHPCIPEPSHSLQPCYCFLKHCFFGSRKMY
jgi:hypothetical protein